MAHLLHVLALSLHGSEDPLVGVAHPHDGLHTLPLTGGEAEQGSSTGERGRLGAWASIDLHVGQREDGCCICR